MEEKILAVDKNLFLYDLAVVSIMKNEAPYVNEWLEYHIWAGVDHFFIYDNDSPDNLKEMLQPYIDAGMVTYIFYPGKCRQMEAYNNAIKHYKFFCRYIAFIDADEFIFPQNNKSIVEVVDEILADNPNAGGLAVNWHCFGSNNLETADYSKGVLERFTRRAPNNWCPPLEEFNNFPGGNAHIKTLANPRRVDYFNLPHFAHYFEGYVAFNEAGGNSTLFSNYPPLAEKIVINHYLVKSKEEYTKKVRRGNADCVDNKYQPEQFNFFDRNEVFDDEILKYLDARKKIDIPLPQISYLKCYAALLQNLSPTFIKNTSKEIFYDQFETFLICRKLAEYLRITFLNEDAGKFFEESALNAIYKIFYRAADIANIRLFLRELPEILPLNYPVVENIRSICLDIIPKIMGFYRVKNAWKEFTEMEYLIGMIQSFESYEHK